MSPLRRARPPAPTFFTTHEVATLLGASLASVVNWVKQGRLLAHTTPGGHRRIALDELVRFARDHDHPLPAEILAHAQAERGPRRLLLVFADEELALLIRDYLRLLGDVEVLIVERALEVGFQLSAFRPELVLLDLDKCEVEAAELATLCERLEQRPVLVGTTTLHGAHIDRLIERGHLREVIERSTNMGDMVDRLRRLLPA